MCVALALPYSSWLRTSRRSPWRGADEPAVSRFPDRRRTSSRNRGTGRERGAPGGKPPLGTLVSSSMSSSRATYSHLTKRGANPGGSGGGSSSSSGSGSGRNMNRDYSINLSVQQVLSLWVQGTVPRLQHFTGMSKSRYLTAGSAHTDR